MYTSCRIILLILPLLVFSTSIHAQTEAGPTVRIGLTPVILDDQTAFLLKWRDYLQDRLDRPVVFVQRESYQDIIDLLRQDRLDFAWICGYPYVTNRSQLRLLVVPVFRGKPLYRSYIIVPASDKQSTSLADLKGKVFAFSDIDSNSGYLSPRHTIIKMGKDPEKFFSRSFFAWSHRKVVDVVAAELAQGGAVDGYIWETLMLREPELVSLTRVVQKSREFGFPPLVARNSISSAEFIAVQKVLLEMKDDAWGAALLKHLNLDGFTTGSERLFDETARMIQVESLSRQAGTSPAPVTIHVAP